MRENSRKKLRKCQFYLRDSNLNDLVTDSDRISSAKCVCSLRLMSWSHTTRTPLKIVCVVIAEKRPLSDKQKTFNDLTISIDCMGIAFDDLRVNHLVISGIMFTYDKNR